MDQPVSFSTSLLHPPQTSQFLYDCLLGRIPVPAMITTTIRNWHERLGIPQIVMCPLENKDGTNVIGWKPEVAVPLSMCGIHLAGGEKGIVYQTWVKYRSTLKQIIREDESEVFDSSYVRLANTAIRIAILAASIDGERQIEIRHMVMAIEFCEKARLSLHRLYTRIQAGETATPTLEDRIIHVARDLRDRGIVAPSQRDFAIYLHMNTVDVLPYLQALAKNGIFKQSPGRKAGSFKFELTEDDDDDES